MLRFGLNSLWNHRFVAALTILSIALSVALVLGVERLRSEAKAGFANSASGIDLIVAARGNPVQILLATVFGVGTTGVGLSWDAFEMIKELPQVAWAVPISMGDNHRGFPVIGTNAEYFEHFRHSGSKSLTFVLGGVFAEGAQAVIGAELKERFGYRHGTEIVVEHGAGSVALDVHDEAPFRVAGVLAPTGTAVDRMIFVSLEGFDELHAQREPVEGDPLLGITEGVGAFPVAAGRDSDRVHGHADDDTTVGGYAKDHASHSDVAQRKHEHAERGHEPDTINAIYVGLTKQTAVLSIQRMLSEYQAEPLTAVLPNLALLELWSITGTAETALRLMATAVVLAGLVGMVVMLSATLEARRREFGILRSVGASRLPYDGSGRLDPADVRLGE
jgi:putative ABC transport system permease protein